MNTHITYDLTGMSQTPDYLHNGTIVRTFDDRRVVLLRGARELYLDGSNATARAIALLRRESFNRLCTRARRALTGRNHFTLHLPEAA